MSRIQEVNILTEAKKSFENNDDSLFNYLKNDVFQTIKCFKYAYTAMMYRDSGKLLGLMRTQRAISELNNLRKELVELKKYWESEVKKVVYVKGSIQDELICHQQMKKFNKMMIGFFVEIKKTKLIESRNVDLQMK